MVNLNQRLIIIFEKRFTKAQILYKTDIDSFLQIIFPRCSNVSLLKEQIFSGNYPEDVSLSKNKIFDFILNFTSSERLNFIFPTFFNFYDGDSNIISVTDSGDITCPVSYNFYINSPEIIEDIVELFGNIKNCEEIYNFLDLYTLLAEKYTFTVLLFTDLFTIKEKQLETAKGSLKSVVIKDWSFENVRELLLKDSMIIFNDIIKQKYLSAGI